MSAHQAVVEGVGIAVPPYAITQETARDFASALFSQRYANFERLLPIFANARIARRYVSQPLNWFGRQQQFADANAIYQEMALRLAREAAEEALQGINRAEVGMVIFVSSSGIATPSLDAALIAALGLSPHCGRLPVWGLGCAGGVAGLARAAELARTMPGKAVLLVAVELCSLTFQYGDLSKSNLIAAALFGDGAAAVVVRVPQDDAPPAGPQLLDAHSTLLPHTENIMGWNVVETGLQVRFARSIPALVERELPGLIATARDAWGVAPDIGIDHFVLHPGGARVLDAYQASLGLGDTQLAAARAVLRDYGNMSSPTVLFVLRRFLETTPAGGRTGIMLALGPGFSAEQLLFRW